MACGEEPRTGWAVAHAECQIIDKLRHVSVRLLPKPFSRELLLTAVEAAAAWLASPPLLVLPEMTEVLDS